MSKGKTLHLVLQLRGLRHYMKTSAAHSSMPHKLAFKPFHNASDTLTLNPQPRKNHPNMDHNELITSLNFTKCSAAVNSGHKKNGKHHTVTRECG